MYFIKSKARYGCINRLGKQLNCEREETIILTCTQNTVVPTLHIWLYIAAKRDISIKVHEMIFLHIL